MMAILKASAMILTITNIEAQWVYTDGWSRMEMVWMVHHARRVHGNRWFLGNRHFNCHLLENTCFGPS